MREWGLEAGARGRRAQREETGEVLCSSCSVGDFPFVPGLIDPFWESLVAQETVPDELVGKGEDDGVRRGDGVEAATRREGQENARGEEEEEKCSRQKIAPHRSLFRR